MAEMHDEILQRLSAIEQERGVRVIHAIESGSRAWGFPSSDSDYDVRFLYAHPKDWYLRLRQGRDVIELPPDPVLDINGWDVRKALGLALKPNAVLLEWLQSPIVYRTSDAFHDINDWVRHVLPVERLIGHYRGLLTGQWRGFIAPHRRVRMKKYLYALRPALTLRYMWRHNTPAPMHIDGLLTVAGPEMEARIRGMLERKAQGDEQLQMERVEAFDELILEELNGNRVDCPPPTDEEWAAGDQLFRKVVQLP